MFSGEGRLTDRLDDLPVDLSRSPGFLSGQVLPHNSSPLCRFIMVLERSRECASGFPYYWLIWVDLHIGFLMCAGP